MNTENEEYITIKQAADIAHVTTQAIYTAIRKGALSAIKRCNRWVMTGSSLEDYRLNKYNRDKRKFNGQFVFNIEKGLFSVSQISKIMSNELSRHFSVQHVYYLIRSGALKASRMGAAWVINREDAIVLLQNYKEKNKIKAG